MRGLFGTKKAPKRAGHIDPLGCSGLCWSTSIVKLIMLVDFVDFGTQDEVQESPEGALGCEMARQQPTGASKTRLSEGVADPLGAISADLQN